MRSVKQCLVFGLCLGCSFASKKGKYLRACKNNECEKGEECNEKGQCTPCKRGTFAPYDKLVSCYTCPPGTYGTDNISSKHACVECSPGLYSEIHSNAECEVCPAGKYQNATGATSCHLVTLTPICNTTHYQKPASTSVYNATLVYARIDHEYPCTSNSISLKSWEWMLIILFSALTIILLIAFAWSKCCSKK